jgi:glycosyltransferase involved in cell wall biosynthesis
VAPEEALLFVQSATAADVVDAFPESPVLYDCADDLAHWHGTSPAMGCLYADLEERVLRRATVVSVTIPRLRARFAERGPRVVPSSNGVGEEFLTPAGLPPDLAAIPRPRLLFTGILSRFVDAELVAGVADSGLGSVVLVGPLDPRAPVAKLRRHPNIFWLGRKEYEELPGYVHGSNLGLIPGSAAAASDCVPSKLFMYCAAGLPVVGHDCSSLRPFADRISLAEGPDAFVTAVREAWRQPRVGRDQRLQLARENTWDRIAGDLLRAAGIPAA